MTFARPHGQLRDVLVLQLGTLVQQFLWMMVDLFQKDLHVSLLLIFE